MKDNVSKFVQTVSIDGKTVLFNTVTREVCPPDDIGQSFVSGSEIEVLRNALLKPYSITPAITLVPTWRCNLRCPHCFVMHQLSSAPSDQRLPGEEIDAERLRVFLKKYLANYSQPVTVGINILGGEATLESRHVSDLIRVSRESCHDSGAKCRVSITTNLSTPLRNEDIEMLNMCDSITVSLDGDQKFHDSSRKIWKNSISGSPFIETIKNLKKLKDIGLNKKTRVQAAANDYFFHDLQSKSSYVAIMKLLGIDNFFVGRVQTTDIWKRNGKEPFDRRTTPCCSYRCMSHLVIDGSGVYASYFDKNASRIGDLDTDLVEMTRAYQDWIERSVPVLKDEKCTSCPVIASCWGQCRGSNVYRENPSAHCDQKTLIEEMKKAIDEDRLMEWLCFNGIREK